MVINSTVTFLIEESRSLERKGEVATAIQRARQAIGLAKNLGDGASEAEACVVLAFAYLRLGKYDEVRRLCQQAIDLAGEYPPARAEALLQLGICAGETDDMDASEEYYRGAIDLGRQIGDDRILVRGLHDLSAGIYMPRGQFALSLAADQEALQIAAKRGMPELTWGPLTTMSWNYWLMGQLEKVEVTLDQLRQAASVGSVGEGYWLYLRASLALEAGDLSTAESLFTQTRSLAENSGVLELNFWAHQGMSRLNQCRRDYSCARDWAADAITLVQRIGYRHLHGIGLIERGRAAWALGDRQPAISDFQEAILLMAPLRLDFDLARAELFLAAALYQQGHPDAAKAWQEAANHIVRGGFAFLADMERALVLPLINAHLSGADPGSIGASQCLLTHLQHVPPAPLKVFTLGGFQVWTGGRVVDKSALRRRKAGELLVLLMLAPRRSLAFEQVVEALWPEREPNAALPLFHQATSALRRAIEPELPEKFPSRYLVVEDRSVSLGVPPGSRLDYESFEAHCCAGEWGAALALYQGDFIPEYVYIDWTAAQRQRLANLHLQALASRGEALLKEGKYKLALDTCQRLLAIEPWHEQAVLTGMQACLAMRDRAGARRLYRQLEKSLSEDLDVQPPEELQALYCSINSL